MYGTLQTANNKRANQTVQMRRVICPYDILIWQKAGLSEKGSNGKISRLHNA